MAVVVVVCLAWAGALIITLGVLGLNLVARTVLRAKRCDKLQGFLFARPMPAAALPGWVQAWPASAECQALLQG